LYSREAGFGQGRLLDELAAAIARAILSRGIAIRPALAGLNAAAGLLFAVDALAEQRVWAARPLFAALLDAGFRVGVAAMDATACIGANVPVAKAGRQAAEERQAREDRADGGCRGRRAPLSIGRGIWLRYGRRKGREKKGD
jgi:hypothetical protein